MEIEEQSLEDRFKASYGAWQAANQVNASFFEREALWAVYTEARDAFEMSLCRSMVHPCAVA